MNNFFGEMAWNKVVDFPITGRDYKPRKKGFTMIIDKGMGLVESKELLELSGEYIDYIKLGFGTSALYREALLKKKVSLVRSYGIDIYPGGTFFEIAWLQNKVNEYLGYAEEIGFSAIEISDGTIQISPTDRENLINQAKNLNFKVITEVGKKDPAEAPSSEDLLNQTKRDISSTADLVIIEGRESGKGIGMYDTDGNIKKDDFFKVLELAQNCPKIMWEAPLKKQQQELILTFGPNVNLGNIAPREILALEALRVGLRGDTLKETIKFKGFKPKCMST